MKYTFNSDEENHFKTISNFKECIIRGGEPVFVWKGLQYGVCFYGDKYCISLTNGEQEEKAGRKILCKRFSTKSRMALESRADSGLTSLINDSHGGQSSMRAGTA